MLLFKKLLPLEASKLIPTVLFWAVLPEMVLLLEWLSPIPPPFEALLPEILLLLEKPRKIPVELFEETTLSTTVLLLL